MKKAKKTAKPSAKKKPAAATKKAAAKPAPKKAMPVRASAQPAPRRSDGGTSNASAPGDVQGIGWKPFRYPPE